MLDFKYSFILSFNSLLAPPLLPFTSLLNIPVFLAIISLVEYPNAGVSMSAINSWILFSSIAM